jgi:hypothetical protein
MLLLDTTLKSLEIVLAGVITTTELPYVVGYVDISQVDFAMTAVREQDGTTNGVTSVTIVPAPTAIPTLTSRQLKFLSISNVDTAVATLAIRVKNTATTRIVWKGTLQVGDNLLYLDDTFLVMDSSGSLKTNFSFGDPLQAVHGGTGIAGYAVGDLLYADTATTLARRADVATGSLLASGGVATAPAWSASPTLTTSLTTPTVIGGTAVGSSLSLQSTSGVGTTDFLRFLVGNNGATEAMRIIDSGFVGIGTIAPVGLLHLSSNTGTRLVTDSAGTAVFSKNVYRAARGTQAALTDIVNGDTIGAFEFQGYSSGYQNGPQITGAVNGTFTTGQAPPTELRFITNAVNAAQVIQMTLNDTGNLGLGVNPPKLRLHARGPLVGSGAPANSGSTAAGNMRVDDAAGISMDFGSINSGIFPGWIQVHDATNQAVNYPLSLQPNGGNVGLGTVNPAALFTVGSGTSSQYQVDSTFKVVKYANVATTGWGHPAIYASGRLVAQTAAVTLTTYTVGAADGSFLISANINVTTSTLHNFTATCVYTDESNVSRTFTFGFSQLAGATLISAITQVTGAGPYESPVSHIRCIAGSTITIATVGGGGFTTVTYNGEGHISQIA